MIHVAIVEDDRVVRDGIAELVAGDPEMTCELRYGSVEAALADRPARPPHVILLDIHLPGMPGSQGVGKLIERFPGVAVLMLTVYADQDKVFESICNGACGYLLKKTPPDRIVDAIRDAHAGGSPMSPEIARKVVELFRKTRAPRQDSSLTARETELLALLVDGHSYEGAAGQLGISINTVRKHVRAIYDKLHVHSKSQAVAKALQHGLVK